MSAAADPLGDWPSPERVAEEFLCQKIACISVPTCWTNARCERRSMPDVKGEARIIDPIALRTKRLREKECRVEDCGGPASDPHHLIYRSNGGDDVEANIIPICHDHHMILHFDATDDAAWVREEIGKALRPEEIAYVKGKLGETQGVSYLERYYHWKGTE